MSADPGIILARYGVDPLRLLAERLLDRHAAALPDLSPHAVLLPRGGAAQRFRSVLTATAAERGHAALLPPWIGTLADWLERYAQAEQPPMSAAAREFVLLDALRAFPDLTGRFGAWPLIDSLLALFDELTSNIDRLPDTPEQFKQLVRDGYGLAKTLAPLDAEAERIYTLWLAWTRHLAEQELSEQARNARMALTRSIDEIAPHAHVYIAGIVELTAAELHWIRTLRGRGQLTLLLHGQTGARGYHPDHPLTDIASRLGIDIPNTAPADDFARWLDDSFSLDRAVLRTRAHDFAAYCPRTPASERLRVFEAADLEHEARAIDVQVRRWHLEGHREIGIITNDRKLARRVRALLERANIRLRDRGGWALSTTSAATALVRWLECLEQDFACAPTLDLLRSPFVTLGLEPEILAHAVRDLDRYVVRTLGVVANLDRYRAAADDVARLAARSGAPAGAVAELVSRLAHAAAPLRRVLRAGSRSPIEYMDALLPSIERLGLMSTYRSDDAGIELLAALDELARALAGRTGRMSWTEFHRWLQRDLERRRLRSAAATAEVELMGLVESRCHRFDRAIVAGCTRDQLPGGPGASPFFNDAVRTHLGLPTLQQRLTVMFYDFRRLLESAPGILLTYRRTEAGQALLASPWLERLTAFHTLAYGGALSDGGLAQVLRVPATLLARRDAPLPTAAQMPRPSLPDTAFPRTMTAGAHQRLVDCPYQFYAADALGLRPLDAVREEVDRSDYGERVHRVLHAFHSGSPGLPGPWRGPLDETNRAAAEELLHTISRAVFAQDVAGRFSARGWLYRWQAIIPAYLDWQQARAHDGWSVEATEQRIERDLAEDIGFTLVGRIDRIDDGPQGDSIIDYKTGRLPRADAVVAGEHVQLPFYSLLVGNAVREVMYLGLHDDGIDDSRRLAGEDLATVRDGIRIRLENLSREMKSGAALPAWGDESTCRYCAMEGLCRKQMWARPRT